MIDRTENIAATLQSLETLGEAGRHDLMVGTAVETNGYFKLSEPKNNWDSQRVEIKAHGIYADGSDDKDAIQNWAKAAQNSIDQRAAQIATVKAAIPLVMRPEGIGDSDLRAACETVLEHPHLSAMCHTDKARALLAQMNRREA